MADGEEPPRLFAPLPGRTEDHSTTYERHLNEVIDLLGVDRPQWTPEGHWHHRARGTIARAVNEQPPREECFAPLLRAAIYDPNPSFNRRLVEPAMVAYGRRRVMEALLAYLRTGTSAERAGAARAWYWTGLPLRDGARYEDFADLLREWRDTQLRVFLTDEHLDVRRCILPGLDLRVEHYPEELRPRVFEAIQLARTHPDDYLRHRVEHQI